MGERKLIIHADMISQPVRAVIAFCELNKIPYEVKALRLFKMEHLDEEY